MSQPAQILPTLSLAVTQDIGSPGRPGRGQPPNGGHMRTTIWASLAGVATAMALVASPSVASANASVDRVGPFETVVPVAYADNAAGVELMFAECDYVQRVERPDGSSVETQHCQLTKPFVEFPGTPPERAFTNRAGHCIWFSDYYLTTTGESLTADTVRITVTPTGAVSVTTTYSPNPTPESEC